MRIIFTTLLSVFLLSCNQNTDKKEVMETPIQETAENSETTKEEFEDLDVEEFNRQLTSVNEELTAQDVMGLYYSPEIENEEGNEEIIVDEDIMDNGNTLVTLIHDNFMDDSVKGEKYLMELSKNENKWKVISIRKNWKCYDGRGHTDWGTEFCL